MRAVGVLLSFANDEAPVLRRICADCVRQSGNSLIVRITLNPTAEASQTVNDTEKFRPIMIMAIASPHSLRSIEGQDVFQASDLMPELAKEISQSNEIATAIGYVKLMN